MLQYQIVVIVSFQFQMQPCLFWSRISEASLYIVKQILAPDLIWLISRAPVLFMFVFILRMNMHEYYLEVSNL